MQAVVADAVFGAVDQGGGLCGGGVRGEELVQEGDVVAAAGFDEDLAGGGALRVVVRTGVWECGEGEGACLGVFGGFLALAQWPGGLGGWRGGHCEIRLPGPRWVCGVSSCGGSGRAERSRGRSMRAVFVCGWCIYGDCWGSLVPGLFWDAVT